MYRITNKKILINFFLYYFSLPSSTSNMEANMSRRYLIEYHAYSISLKKKVEMRYHMTKKILIKFLMYLLLLVAVARPPQPWSPTCQGIALNYPMSMSIATKNFTKRSVAAPKNLSCLPKKQPQKVNYISDQITRSLGFFHRWSQRYLANFILIHFPSKN